jgi:hypothetical protein
LVAFLLGLQKPLLYRFSGAGVNVFSLHDVKSLFNLSLKVLNNCTCHFIPDVRTGGVRN